MTGFFSDKYRRGTHRLPGRDYSAPGKYFITICTRNMDHFLGRIENDVMILSETGKIVEGYWLEIPSHYHDTNMDEYIIMPDHIHGIIIIESKSKVTIGVIINQFKRICIIMSKLKGFELAWHPRYYDHIIRNNKDLSRIRKYIRDNPGNYYR